MTAPAQSILQHVQSLVAAHDSERRSDRELLRRFAQQRDEAAFAALVRRHGTMVRGVCRRVLPNLHDADDAFQATFLTLARQAGAGTWSESVAPWLHVVAQRLALRVRAAAARRRKRETRAARPAAPDPLAALSGRELCSVIDAELGALPERIRAPLVLCCLEGQTRDEAARQLGWSLATLKRRLDEGRQRLRKRLQARGLELPAVLAGALALDGLAQAALPLELAAATVQAAVTGKPTTALVGEILRGGGGLPVKGAAAALALCLAAVATAGWTLLPSSPSVAESRPQQPTPGKQPQEPKPRTDLLGDPLPEGAIARLGTLRLKHGGYVQYLAFTPDGKQLMSRSHAEGIRIWDAPTGRQLNHLAAGADEWVSSAQLTPDGQTLITLEGTRQPYSLFVRWRNRTDLQVRRECKVEDFDTLDLSPDGKVLLAQGTGRDTAELVDATTGQKLHSFKSHGWPYCQVFTADSKTLITGGRDGVIRLRDVASGALQREITGHPNVVSIMALSGDGRLLATVGATEQKHGDAATYPWDHFIRIWDLAAGKELRQLAMPKKEAPWGGFYGITSLAFAPDGKTLVSAGNENLLRFWDPSTGQELRPPVNFCGASQLTFAPDGKTLAVVGGSSSIQLLDVASGKPALAKVGHARIHALALTPDGRTVATAGSDNDIRIWDAATGREREPLRGHEQSIVGLRLAADGRTLLSTSGDKTLRLWDLQTGKEIRKLSSPQLTTWYGTLLTMSGDGKRFVIAGTDQPQTAVIVDAVTGNEIRRLAGHDPWLTGAAFTPDGRTLVTWDAKQQVRLWDVATGETRKKYALIDKGRSYDPAGSYPSYTAVVSPDGLLIAACSQGRFLGLQALVSGKQVRAWENLPDGVSAAAFSPDGRMLAWGGWRQRDVHVLELATGQERAVFVGHHGRIIELAFSTAGGILVSAGEDSTAVVWDLRGASAAAAAPLSQEALTTCWADLGANDAKRAFRAIGKLVSSPSQAVDLLKQRLKPVASLDAKQVVQWITALNSDTFATRDAAMKELASVVEVAEPALRAALDKAPNLESRRRLEQLLEKLEGLGSHGEPLRISRAVEVMEQIGTAEVRQLLTLLAGGASRAWLTREAQAALDRFSSGRPAAQKEQ
jgi:RNA polymerase sigma factor (sigma-70 family)